MASIAAKVTGDICAGVAEAKMAAKNATDFGFALKHTKVTERV